MARPAIVLADEPTGNLDSATGAGVLDLLEELHAEGATIAVITHDPAIAGRLPRRVDLRDGRIERDRPGRGGGMNRPGGSASATCSAVAGTGLRTRRLRAALSALGIAIGIAAMVAVLGISESSRADLLAQLDRLGTNLLRVTPGETFFGAEAKLPKESPGMLRRVGPVERVAATGNTDATVRRSDLIPEAETGGISVLAADPELLGTLGGELAAGRFLNRATARYPAVVLGAKAAERLGVTGAGRQVWLGGRWFTVVGILRPVTLAPEIDRAALVGFPAAEALLGSDGSPGTVYVRADPDQVEAVREVLPATANPANPNEVRVSRPSDALAARAAANTAFTSLLLGLGAVALLVGGVGIANVMVISVLERRSEIGLRRALGATKGHVGVQFLAESLLLALAGGLAGVVPGGGGHRRLRRRPRLVGGRPHPGHGRRPARRPGHRRRRRPLPRAAGGPPGPHRRAPDRLAVRVGSRHEVEVLAGRWRPPGGRPAGPPRREGGSALTTWGRGYGVLRSIRSQFTATLAPWRRVTMIMGPSVGSRGPS